MKERQADTPEERDELEQATADLDASRQAERLRRELKSLLVTVSPDDFHVGDIEEIVTSTSRQFIDTWMQREEDSG